MKYGIFGYISDALRTVLIRGVGTNLRIHGNLFITGVYRSHRLRAFLFLSIGDFAALRGTGFVSEKKVLIAPLLLSLNVFLICFSATSARLLQRFEYATTTLVYTHHEKDAGIGHRRTGAGCGRAGGCDELGIETGVGINCLEDIVFLMERGGRLF